MIVDSSVLVAVLLRERGYEDLERRLGAADSLGVGAPTLVETAVVTHARVGALSRTLLPDCSTTSKRRASSSVNGTGPWLSPRSHVTARGAIRPG